MSATAPDIKCMLIAIKSSSEDQPQIFSNASPGNGNLINCYAVRISHFSRERTAAVLFPSLTRHMIHDMIMP